MPTTDVSITSRTGKNLAAFLDRPTTKFVATAVFAHCFAGSAKSPAATRVARGLMEKGYAVLRFDFTGLGASGGDFADTTFTSNRHDLRDAVEWMSENVAAPSLLIGHSLGGAAVLAVAGTTPGLRGVVTIGAPFEPSHVTHLFHDDIQEIMDKGEAEVTISGKKLTIGKEFVEDLGGIDQEERIHNMGVPLLVMHSPDDELVDIGNAQSIYRAAQQSKSFIALDGADHLLTRKGHAAYAADVIAAWAGRYVDEEFTGEGAGASAATVKAHESAQVATPTARSHTNSVVARHTDGSDFTTELTVGAHRVLADEPTTVPGAADLGPSPFDLVKMSLAACTSMTMGMYARRKGFDLGSTQVSIDLDQTRDEDGTVTRFTRSITFDDALSEEQRLALVKIANKCPVHRLLEGKIEVDTFDTAELADAATLD